MLEDDWYTRGTAYLLNGRFAQAITEFSNLLHHPNKYYADAAYSRGCAHYSCGRYDAALADVNWAMRVNKSGTSYDKRLSKIERASLKKQYNEKLAECYYKRGQIHFALGSYQEACADFDYALLLRPEDPNIYFNRSRVSWHRGQHQDAINDLSQALEYAHHNDSRASYYNDRGKIYYGLGQFYRALQEFTNATILSSDPQYHYNRGKAFFRLGRCTHAQKCFELAVKEKPENICFRQALKHTENIRRPYYVDKSFVFLDGF